MSFKPSNRIIWISSYPKSGNTWLRFFLANYFFNPLKIFDPKIISTIKKFPIDEEIEKIASAESIIKNPYDISKYWIESQSKMKTKDGNIVFLKNHNSLVNINNYEFTNELLSMCFIYIVRDPRDVVVSYAHYKNISYDKAIQHLCSKNLNYVYSLNNRSFPRVEILGSWKFHYISWRDGIPNIPRIIIKYENLIQNPYKNFYKIIEFLSKIMKLKINEHQIKLSIELSNFDNLKNYEKEKGFFENSSKNSFFRTGKSDNWKKELNNTQVNLIEKEFFSEMNELGYL